MICAVLIPDEETEDQRGAAALPKSHSWSKKEANKQAFYQSPTMCCFGTYRTWFPHPHSDLRNILPDFQRRTLSHRASAEIQAVLTRSTA